MILLLLCDKEEALPDIFYASCSPAGGGTSESCLGAILPISEAAQLVTICSKIVITGSLYSY